MKYFAYLFCLLFAAPASALCNGPSILDTFTSEEISTAQTRADAMPFGVGNRWTATKGDKTIHLIGTFHISDPRLDEPVSRILPDLHKVGVLLVEATPQAQDDLKRYMIEHPEKVYITSGPTLPDLLTPATWDNLRAAAKARNIPSFMAAKFQPWYLGIALSMPPCAIASIAAGAKGLDHRLMDAAMASKIPLVALEPFDTLIRVAGSDPIDQQIRDLEIGLLPDPDTADATLVALRDAYFNEEIAYSWEISRLQALKNSPDAAEEIDGYFTKMEQSLLIDRNHSWIPVIEEQIAQHPTIMLAFGAAHLMGDDGILSLLQAKGYTITRVPF